MYIRAETRAATMEIPLSEKKMHAKLSDATPIAFYKNEL